MRTSAVPMFLGVFATGSVPRTKGVVHHTIAQSHFYSTYIEFEEII